MPKSKSAYSTPTKVSKLETHIIVVWVDNEASVLSRVVGLFSGRGYNIESLAVAEVDQKNNLSRITIVTTGTPQVIDQIKLQLTKLVPVHKVADFKREDKKVIFKEMALFKVVGNKNKLDKAFKACKKYNGIILDPSICVQPTSCNLVERLLHAWVANWLYRYSELTMRKARKATRTNQPSTETKAIGINRRNCGCHL